jgi:ABC-type Zn uptake system ZnuABC Zn-binding protein ZnuA
MKNIAYILGIILFLSFIVTTVSAEEDDIKIVCTNSILSDFTSNLIKENVTIDYIMPSGVCPAFYDTTPSDINKVTNADIIISFGSAQMEPWLADLLEYNQDYDLIECKDMGEWNIPTGAKAFVQYITEELIKIYPELNETITSNSESYLSQINGTASSLKEIIETNGHQDKKIIAMSWQKDFLEWLGLNVTYSYGPPQTLSAQDEIEVINAAMQDDVTVIVDNLQSGTNFGAQIASETGKSHVIFSNFPGAIPGTDNYLDMISYNTNQLVEGIETYEYKQGDISNLENRIKNLEFERNISIVFVLIFAVIIIALYALYKKK